MLFQKGHKLGAKKSVGRELDKQSISFKGYKGTRDKLRQMPDWQTKMRDYVERLIDDTGTGLPPP